MSATPRVTVLMSVYNGDKYLHEAIDSILTQTFTNFAFLIINDGSTDRSRDIIRSYNDSRITLIDNGRNIGLIASLNKGLDMAQGEYVARMDADDISLPHRLEKQVTFMDANPDIAVCGSSARLIGANIDIRTKLPRALRNVVSREGAVPANSDAVACMLLFANSMVHPSVIIRRCVIDTLGLRYPDCKYAEDYALWVAVSKYYRLSNIAEILLLYRRHSEQTTVARANFEDLVQNDVKIKLDLYKHIGMEVSEREKALVKFMMSMPRSRHVNKQCLYATEGLLKKIVAHNQIKRFYNHVALLPIVADTWYTLCLKAAAKGVWTWSICFKSPLSESLTRPFAKRVTMLFFLSIGRARVLRHALRRTG